MKIFNAEKCPYCNTSDLRSSNIKIMSLCSQCRLYVTYNYYHEITFWSCYTRNYNILSSNKNDNISKIIGRFKPIVINEYFEMPDSFEDFEKLTNNLIKLNIYI